MTETYGRIIRDIEPKFSGPVRSGMDRIVYEFRYLKLLKSSESFRRVKAKGYTAGFWGQSKKACPVREGFLQGAWLQGWQLGRDKRAEIKESKSQRTGT
jgi:ribosome modulation factor